MGGSTLKEYKVIKFDCYVEYQKQLEDLLNEMGKQDWNLKLIFHQPDMAFADAVFERVAK